MIMLILSRFALAVVSQHHRQDRDAGATVCCRTTCRRITTWWSTPGTLDLADFEDGEQGLLERARRQNHWAGPGLMD